MKKKPLIIVDDAIPYIKGFPEQFANVIYLPGSEISRHHLAGVDALVIRTRTKCNEALLSGTPVKFIATATIGFEHIDIRYCKKKSIIWANAPGCNAGSVMQYVVAALLHICVNYGLDPSKMTLGVIGAGHTGSRVAEAAGILGMRVLVNDPPRQRKEKATVFTDLPELLSESDVVTLHVPLNHSGRDATFHLAGGAFLSSMKSGAFLINTSRGDVSDEKAVKKALQDGRLKGYVADVWSGEPEPDRELIEMSLLATPHIAGYSADGKLKGTLMALSALTDHFGISVSLPGENLLPLPEKTTIDTAECQGLSLVNRLNCIVSTSYDITGESGRFVRAPDRFEYIRNNYPPRREFGAFMVRTDKNAGPLVSKLGFKII